MGDADTKVILVLEYLEMGGAERQAIYLAEHLISRPNYSAEVWGFGPPGAASRLCDTLGIPWRSDLLPGRNRGSTRSLTDLTYLALQLRMAKPDVVLPYTQLPNVLCNLALAFSCIKCLWNQRDEGRPCLRSWIERLALNRADLVTTNSRVGRDFLGRKYGFDVTTIRSVRNAVEVPRPQPTLLLRRRLGISPDAVVAIMVGNLHQNKDHLTLLEAWRIVASADRRGMHLVLAGRFDSEAQKLKAFAWDHRLERVHFLGGVPNVGSLLPECDLLVHSSRREGTPNAVLEGMACGLAVVSSDVGDTREVLGPRQEPYIVAPGDPASLAAAMMSLASDPERRKQLGAENLERATKLFDPNAVLEDFTELIATLT